MEQKLQYKRLSNLLIIACFLMVAFMMASKFIYTAEMVEILDKFGFQESQFTLPITIYFIVYATTQLVLAVFFKKINIKIYLALTVSLSCVLTIIMAFSTGLVYFCVMLTINGILQAGLWAGCMYTATKHLPESMIPKANTFMTCGFPAGSVVTYCIASIVVAMDAWWLGFVIIGICFGLVLLFFYVVVSKLERLPKHVAIEIDQEVKFKDKGNSSVNIGTYKTLIPLQNKCIKIVFYVLVGAICFLAYTIYSSVIDFIPKMLTDTFEMKNSLAIIFSAVVPIGVAFGPIVVIMLCEKVNNYIALSIVCVVGLIGLLVAVLYGYSVNFVLAIVLLLSTALFARGVNAIYETVIIAKMSRQINTGSFAAYTNAIASFGAAAAPFIMGRTIEIGWSLSYTVILIEAIALAVFIGLLLIFCVRKKKS